MSSFTAESQYSVSLAGAVIGSAVHLSIFETLTYEALAAGVPVEADALAEAAWRGMAARGDRLRRDGNRLESAEENLAVLRTAIGDLLASAVPTWRRIGAL